MSTVYVVDIRYKTLLFIFSVLLFLHIWSYGHFLKFYSVSLFGLRTLFERRMVKCRGLETCLNPVLFFVLQICEHRDKHVEAVKMRAQEDKWEAINCYNKSGTERYDIFNITVGI